jgi:ABC-2 type transport system permease protein
MIYLFPDIPQWIGYIFPTYYIVRPIIEVSQNGAGFGEIVLDVSIALALTVALIGGLVAVARRARLRAA